MKNKAIFLLILCFLFSFFKLKSQTLLSTGGTEFKNDNISLSWSLGETIIETHNSENITLTQGFQQPDIIITSIYESDRILHDVNVYPNPLIDHIIIEIGNIDSFKNVQYKIFDNLGSLILSEGLNQHITNIKLDNISTGQYFITIQSDGIIQKTYKLIKLH